MNRPSDPKFRHGNASLSVTITNGEEVVMECVAVTTEEAVEAVCSYLPVVPVAPDRVRADTDPGEGWVRQEHMSHARIDAELVKALCGDCPNCNALEAALRDVRHRAIAYMGLVLYLGGERGDFLAKERELTTALDRARRALSTEATPEGDE